MKQQSNRRTVLAGLAMAPLAALPALAETGELQRLIAAYRDAYAAFLVVVDELEEAENSYEEMRKKRRFDLAPNLITGGGREMGRHFTLEEALEDLRRSYANYRKEVESLARLSPDGAAQMLADLNAKEVENIALVEEAFAAEAARKEAHGLTAVERRYRELGDAEEAAAAALILYSPKTPIETRVKGAALKESGSIMDFIVDPSSVIGSAILAAICGGDAVETATDPYLDRGDA